MPSSPRWESETNIASPQAPRRRLSPGSLHKRLQSKNGGISSKDAPIGAPTRSISEASTPLPLTDAYSDDSYSSPSSRNYDPKYENNKRRSAANAATAERKQQQQQKQRRGVVHNTPASPLPLSPKSPRNKFRVDDRWETNNFTPTRTKKPQLGSATTSQTTTPKSRVTAQSTSTSKQTKTTQNQGSRTRRSSSSSDNHHHHNSNYGHNKNQNRKSSSNYHQNYSNNLSSKESSDSHATTTEPATFTTVSILESSAATGRGTATSTLTTSTISSNSAPPLEITTQQTWKVVKFHEPLPEDQSGEDTWKLTVVVRETMESATYLIHPQVVATGERGSQELEQLWNDDHSTTAAIAPATEAGDNNLLKSAASKDSGTADASSPSGSNKNSIIHPTASNDVSEKSVQGENITSSSGVGGPKSPTHSILELPKQLAALVPVVIEYMYSSILCLPSSLRLHEQKDGGYDPWRDVYALADVWNCSSLQQELADRLTENAVQDVIGALELLKIANNYHLANPLRKQLLQWIASHLVDISTDPEDGHLAMVDPTDAFYLLWRNVKLDYKYRLPEFARSAWVCQLVQLNNHKRYMALEVLELLGDEEIIPFVQARHEAPTILLATCRLGDFNEYAPMGCTTPLSDLQHRCVCSMAAFWAETIKTFASPAEFQLYLQELDSNVLYHMVQQTPALVEGGKTFIPTQKLPLVQILIDHAMHIATTILDGTINDEGGGEEGQSVSSASVSEFSGAWTEATDSNFVESGWQDAMLHKMQPARLTAQHAKRHQPQDRASFIRGLFGRMMNMPAVQEEEDDASLLIAEDGARTVASYEQGEMVREADEKQHREAQLEQNFQLVTF